MCNYNLSYWGMYVSGTNNIFYLNSLYSNPFLSEFLQSIHIRFKSLFEIYNLLSAMARTKRLIKCHRNRLPPAPTFLAIPTEPPLYGLNFLVELEWSKESRGKGGGVQQVTPHSPRLPHNHHNTNSTANNDDFFRRGAHLFIHNI